MEGKEKVKETKKKVSKKKTTENKSENTINVSFIKEFSEKQFGVFKGVHLIACGALLILLILIMLINGSGVSKGENPEYSMVYQNSDGELMVIAKNQKEGSKISSDSETRDVIYANKTNRYVLFEKNSSLYLYDAKKKDDTIKIVTDYTTAYFTENDKYIIALDQDGNLYSYNFKKDKEKLDSDVTSVKGYTDTKVLYVKDGSLYIRSLNAKKDDKAKIEDENGSYASISEDGKRVVYINKEGDLKYYLIKNGKGDKIASDVTEYYCDETCKHMYYVVSDGENNLYYYNGKEGSKVASDIYEISGVNVLDKQVVYAKEDDKEFTLYYKKGLKDEVKIEDGLEKMVYSYIYNGKGIYYESDSELKYVKINGTKIGDVKTVVEDVESSYTYYKKGLILVADVDKKSNGDLYFVTNAKAKKVDSDVYSSYLKVSNEGNRLYYLKDYSSNSGDLYTTKGGKGKKIDTDVYRYVYISDKNLYYLKDYSSSKKYGDMYFYNGSKGKKVAEDVRSLASNPNRYIFE